MIPKYDKKISDDKKANRDQRIENLKKIKNKIPIDEFRKASNSIRPKLREILDCRKLADNHITGENTLNDVSELSLQSVEKMYYAIIEEHKKMFPK
jgi:hypothetical protein